MSLSDEEHQKFEQDFKYLVSKYVEFISRYNQLITKERSVEEEKEYLAVQQLLLNIGEVLSVALKSMGDDLFGKALDFHAGYAVNNLSLFLPSTDESLDRIYR